MTQTAKPAKLRPFHETITDAVRRCNPDPSSGEIMRLFQLIEETRIPENHDQIIAAIDEYFGFANSARWAPEIRKIKENLLEQKQAEMLKKYVGGQMEIQGQIEKYLYRGEVKDIAIENNKLRVQFMWFAKGDGFPPLPEKWVNDHHLDYATDLDLYALSDIGDKRLCFISSIVGEMIILYPPDGSKLDPSKVEGLALQQHPATTEIEEMSGTRKTVFPVCSKCGAILCVNEGKQDADGKWLCDNC